MVQRRPDKEDLRHGDITFSEEDVEHDFEFEDDEGEDDLEGDDEVGEAQEDDSITEDDPDYDLSQAAGYADWEPPQRSFFLPQWLIVAISLLLILTLLLPALRWFG